MSQPERYEPRARSIGGPWKMVKCKDGPYVCHEQHAEIVAALAADKQAADRATFDAIRAFTVLKDEVAALQAENERLRKAGDWQPIETAPTDGRIIVAIGHHYQPMLWKTGKPSENFAGEYLIANITHWLSIPAFNAAKEVQP